jgi:hypothetical protein
MCGRLIKTCLTNTTSGAIRSGPPAMIFLKFSASVGEHVRRKFSPFRLGRSAERLIRKPPKPIPDSQTYEKKNKITFQGGMIIEFVRFNSHAFDSGYNCRSVKHVGHSMESVLPAVDASATTALVGERFTWEYDIYQIHLWID